jgi:pyrroloquinoline quinone (PQQ) biosynthesis protein C
MEITREWIEEISDEQGLTKGQQELLLTWCKEHPFVGKQIPDQVANFLKHCKGYREIPAYVKEFKGWF